jgi:hypothetical protein
VVHAGETRAILLLAALLCWSILWNSGCYGGVDAKKNASPVYLNLGWISHGRSSPCTLVSSPDGNDPVKTFLLLSHLCIVFATITRAEEAFDSSSFASPQTGNTHFLIIGKGKVVDPLPLQERGVAAVNLIAEASKSLHPPPIVDALAEQPMTVAAFHRGQGRQLVTGDVVRKHLRQLSRTVAPADTVVIYTHSHGRKSGFQSSQPLGGLVLDLPAMTPKRAGTLLWDEFAELLLEIPGKNVLVLTMSCFSGGLIEFLESPEIRMRWQNRRAVEGRNFIVITSQDSQRKSVPITIDGIVINPFTYAVARVLSGKAVVFHAEEDAQDDEQLTERWLTVGETIDGILWLTKHTPPQKDHEALQNNAQPQYTGSFDREDILFLTGPP